MTSINTTCSALVRTTISSAMLMLLTGCGGGSDPQPASVAPVTPPVSQPTPQPQPPSPPPQPPPPPPAPTYTIGGVVSGLEGTLQLSNNGGDTRTLTANGAFTFATALAANASYAVTVEAAPLGQQCTLTNGLGTVAANVSNISIDCVNLAAWREAQIIHTYDAGSVQSREAGFDDAGNAIVVWMHYDHATGHQNVAAKHYRAGAGWGAAVLLEHSVEQVLRAPQIAVAANGDAIAGWIQRDGIGASPAAVFISRYDAATQTWSAPQAIDASDEHVWTLRLAFDRSGAGYAAWLQGDSAESVWVNRYSTSSGWNGASLLAATGAASHLDLAVSENGAAMAAWRKLDALSGEERVWVSRTTGSEWTAPEAITGSGAADEDRSVDIAVDALGASAVLAFMRHDAANDRDHVHAARFSNDAWAAAEPLQTNTEAASPFVAMRGNGEAMVLWAQRTPEGSQKWAQPYGALSGPAAPISAIAPPTRYGVDYGRPAAAFTATGAVIAVWDVSAEGAIGDQDRDLFTARYVPGNASPWSTPLRLVDSPEYVRGHTLAVSPTGSALVLWMEGTPGGSDFWMLKGSEYR